MWIFSLRLQVCTRLQQHENNSGPTQLQATAASTHLLQSCCFFPPKCTETHAGLRYTHARTQLYPAAVFLTVNQWVGLHLQQNDPSRCCFLSPRCLTPPPCCCPAVSLSVFVCASVSLLVCVCVCMRWRGFTAVRARLRRLKRRRRSAASLPACWRYVTAPSCRCQAPLPP